METKRRKRREIWMGKTQERKEGAVATFTFHVPAIEFECQAYIGDTVQLTYLSHHLCCTEFTTAGFHALSRQWLQ